MVQYLEWLERIGVVSFSKGNPGTDVVAKMRDKASMISIDDDIGDAFVWACLSDRRVSARNRECAELLKSIRPDFFRWIEAQNREARKFSGAIGVVADWRPAFVGATVFKPEKPSTLNLDAPKADTTKPVYVVRQEGNSVFLKKAFVPGKEKPWAPTKGMKDMKVPVSAGEPLFQVRYFDKTINPDEEISKILQSAPPGSAREFSKDNFWIEIGK